MPPKITQEMIQAYDDYTHLTLDRRGFMEKLTRLAGSGAAAAAIAPMLMSNYAKAQIVAPDDPRLKIEEITYPGPAGEVKGYLAMPADAAGKLPAVIVIHENRGLKPHIKDVTRRLALEGFVALGVDLLSRAGRHAGDRRRGGRDVPGHRSRRARARCGGGDRLSQGPAGDQRQGRRDRLLLRRRHRQPDGGRQSRTSPPASPTTAASRAPRTCRRSRRS